MVAIEVERVLARAAPGRGDQPRASAPGAQKRRFSLRHIAPKLISHDPRRLAILGRIRLIWRKLPPNGVLLFFDEQPIAVKAYGGWRYTTAQAADLGSWTAHAGLVLFVRRL